MLWKNGTEEVITIHSNFSETQCIYQTKFEIIILQKRVTEPNSKDVWDYY